MEKLMLLDLNEIMMDEILGSDSVIGVEDDLFLFLILVLWLWFFMCYNIIFVCFVVI